MKTSKRFFQLVLALVTLSLVGCGQNNTSGKSNNNNNNNGVINTLPGGGGIINPGGGTINANQVLQAVINDVRNVCPNGHTQAYPIQVNNLQVNSSGFNVGITMEGDIALASNGIMQVYLCNRGIQIQNIQSLRVPILNESPNCQVDEITAYDAIAKGITQGWNGQQIPINLTLEFFPIQVPQLGIYSSLCQR